MNILPVPWFSQWAPGANAEINDCAFAGLRSIRRSFGLPDITVDQLFKLSGLPHGSGAFLSSHVKKVAYMTGLPVRYHTRVPWDVMLEFIDHRRPFITVIPGGGILHAVTVIGMDAGEMWFLDPTHGKRKWSRAWYERQMGNRTNAVLVTVDPIPAVHPGSPPPVPIASRPAPAGDNTYTVKRGDGLWRIAIAHGTTVRELCHLNGILNANLIHVGDVLRLR